MCRDPLGPTVAVLRDVTSQFHDHEPVIGRIGHGQIEASQFLGLFNKQ